MEWAISPYWVLWASSATITTSLSILSSNLSNLLIIEKIYDFDLSEIFHFSSVLFLIKHSSGNLPRILHDLKLLNICLSKSCLSTMITKAISSPLLIASFLAFSVKNNIEKLLPLPWVCQKVPILPSFSFLLFQLSKARFTPKNWWFRAIIFINFLILPLFWLVSSSPSTKLSWKIVKFLSKSKKLFFSQVPFKSISIVFSSPESSSFILCQW
ncbi:hypothetical protein MSU_0819 [Mycoplasma suis str. Illinois]|uniref:Uncharacterized protein n=1 Tax=Mycoplasma suis (strain Illinois) TaxID=768700 RepID=F0QS70_MYCSL|nr:hypothetical protein MSU_0819 [Mycoplasma suis str. Illinois]